MVLPPATGTGPLAEARAIIRARIDDWARVATVHQEMPPFRQWLTTTGREAGPVALSVTSHHGHDNVWFVENDRLFSKQIRRELPRASIAILNGCGTGGPGATDFVGELSKRGVSAVIATNTQVAGGLAGAYLDCLTRIVERNSGTTLFDLSQAHFAAVHCASARTIGKNTSKTYGSRALAYMLLGNGGLKLCLPQRRD
jgi:hypothetical protein